MTAAPGAVRDGALDCYNMFAYLDGEFVQSAVALLTQPDGKAGRSEEPSAASSTAATSSAGTSRARSTIAPGSLDALFALDEVELFDLGSDPHQLENLALDRRKNAALLESMNAKLNRLLDDEVGEDKGQMLTPRVDGGWVATDAIRDV